MSDSPRRPLNTDTVEVQLTDAEANFLNNKGERFHAAELSLAQAQETLAAAQREYDQQFGRLQGAVEQLLEMKGMPTDGASVRYDAEQRRVVLTLPAGSGEGK